MEPRKSPVNPADITADDWLLLLVHDTKTYSKTKKSISLIIEHLGERYTSSITNKERRKLHQICLRLVAAAAEKYLQNLSERRGSKFYKFSTYFSWWAIEVYSTYDPKTKQITSTSLQNALKHIEH